MLTKDLKEKREKLEKEKTLTERKLNNITRELLSLHIDCEHKNEDGSDSFLYAGTDFRNDYYRCSICGYKKRK